MYVPARIRFLPRSPPHTGICKHLIEDSGLRKNLYQKLHPPRVRIGLPLVTTLLLLLPLAALGQRGGRHGSSGTNSGTTAQPEDPDVATFKHAISEQATEEQIAQFGLMMKATEAARQQAHDLRLLGSNADNPDDLATKAAGLQDAAERAQSENRTFQRSLSDSQAAALKKLTKSLTKSDAAVSKDAKAFSEQLEQTRPNSGRLLSGAAHLEKALAVFQSDQLALGKEMGIQSH